LLSDEDSWADAEWSDTDWDAVQAELDASLDAPKIKQLESINIRNILNMVPAGETWLICLGRFRVRWSSDENWESWWSPKVVWWMGRIDLPSQKEE